MDLVPVHELGEGLRLTVTAGCARLEISLRFWLQDQRLPDIERTLHKVDAYIRAKTGTNRWVQWQSNCGRAWIREYRLDGAGKVEAALGQEVSHEG